MTDYQTNHEAKLILEVKKYLQSPSRGYTAQLSFN